MNKDYTYCLDKFECVNRHECKRWLGNYSDVEVKELYTLNRFVNEVDDSECIKNDFNLFDEIEKWQY